MRLRAAKNSLYTLALRLGLVYAAYMLSRVIFYLLNYKTFGFIPLAEWPEIIMGGLLFDTSAIAYTNILFILLALFPVKEIISLRSYQRLYDAAFLTVNGACLILNAVDFFYFRYNLKRITADFAHWAGESNVMRIMMSFAGENWYVFVLAAGLLYLFYKWYRRIPLYVTLLPNAWLFGFVHLLLLSGMTGLSIAGMRGGFLHSTRPITLSNAGKYVSRPDLMPVVLNTPFSLIRTFDKKAYPEKTYMPEEEAIQVFNPVKNYSDSLPFEAKNVVILIIESLSREHSGYLNPNLGGGEYKGYTPFLDSLMKESLVCTNAFANGRKSIDAMPSILAGIPSLVLPYVLSHNSLNKINSLASLLKPKGYRSAFFHGAPNSSMGFQAFSRIAGFDQYYGKDEYGNDADYDGIWGIWDEEFLQYFGRQLDTFTPPFLGICFTLSSHHPFKVPPRYEGVFPEGKLPVHACVSYTDMALRKFFEVASTKPWYRNTLFVITADHSTVAWSEKYNSPVGAFAIPILYFSPGGLLRKTYQGVTQQTDIMPSVLDYLHFDQPFVAFGNSIFDDEAEPFALHYNNEQYQVIDSDHRLSLFDGNKITGVYDIRDSWSLGGNKVLLPAESESELLRFHQAVIQQYNQRILHNKLTVHQ
ncbi:MAG TPA: sulfatase-like hydrolase/transferase [Saprospiraceae bacterium]|nr:sulfatase-like hydrolase/transferase [Saprospiraceae bacterium]